MRYLAWILAMAGSVPAGETEDVIARIRAAADEVYRATATPDRPPPHRRSPLEDVYHEMTAQDRPPLDVQAEWRALEAFGAEAVPALLALLAMSVPSNEAIEKDAHARIDRWARHVMAKPTREQQVIAVRRKQALILAALDIANDIEIGALDTLGRIGPAARAAAPELKRRFDEGLQGRRAAHLTAALLDIDGADAAVTKQALKWMADDEFKEQHRVLLARALVRYGARRPPDCRRLWARVLRAEDAVRAAGIDTVADLGLAGLPLAAPLLASSNHRIASATREAVTRVAAAHLGALDEATVAALAPVANDIVDLVAGRLAQPDAPRAGLARLLGHARKKRSAATRALLPLLDAPAADVRRAAVEALGRLRAKAALPKLREMLAAADPDLTAAVQAAIDTIEG